MDQGCGKGQALDFLRWFAILDVRVLLICLRFFFHVFLSRCINKGKIESQPQMCLKHFINGVLQPYSSQFAMLLPPPPYTSLISAIDLTPTIPCVIGEPPGPALQALPAQSSEVRGMSRATSC